MKICDVVLNSVWFDPRVRKQLIQYVKTYEQVVAVGIEDDRYNEAEISKSPCPVIIGTIDSQLKGHQRSIFKKLKRERKRITTIRDIIVKEKPDIIHANDLNALIPSYLAKRKLKCKLVYDSHEINVENYRSKVSPIIPFVMRRIEKFLVKRTDIMVCVSHAASDYFAQTYKITQPMVVTNCALKEEQPKVSQSGKVQFFEVLNHGRFYSGRGYETMIRASSLLRSYNDIRLAIRGFGKIEEELHHLAEELEVEDSFVFYPPVSVNELVTMASRSHVGVAITEPLCLNFKLSVSNKIFEYAAAGLPVIMSNIPEHVYLNDKYKFGVVMRDNTPESLRDAILELYQNTELYETCSKNALALSNKLYWEVEFSKLVDAEKKLLQVHE